MDPLLDRSPADPPPPRVIRVPVGRMILWIVLLTIGFYAVAHFPTEVSYWYLAAAWKAYEEGRQDEALALVDRAENWSPDDTLSSQVRTNLLASGGSAEKSLRSLESEAAKDIPNEIKTQIHLQRYQLLHSLERYEEALQAYDAAADYHSALRPATRRTELLLQLNRHKEAQRELAQVKQNEGSTWWDMLQRPTTHDNDIAYFSALLNDDLEDALIRINRALVQHPNEPALLDTRGYVLYRLSRFEEALPDLDKAVELAEKQLADLKQPQAQKLLKKGVAVMLYHRSLVLDKLEKSAQAEADRQRVRELGFEPNDRLF